jgi:hypothetical protein
VSNPYISSMFLKKSILLKMLFYCQLGNVTYILRIFILTIISIRTIILPTLFTKRVCIRYKIKCFTAIHNQIIENSMHTFCKCTTISFIVVILQKTSAKTFYTHSTATLLSTFHFPSYNICQEVWTLVTSLLSSYAIIRAFPSSWYMWDVVMTQNSHVVLMW